MKHPARYSQGRVKYTGRIDSAAFAAWSESAEGRSVLQPIVTEIPFAPFGRVRAARRRLWRQLTRAAQSETVVARLQRAIDSFLARLNTFVYARDLPCVGVDLHRLVVVPRLFANAAIDRRIETSVEGQPVFAGPKGRLLLDWFIMTVIEGIEAAVIDARPSPKQPLAAGDGWIVVGVNDRFEWRIPFKGPAWHGHYYVLELTRMPMTRAVRKSTGDAMARLEASLPSLSRAHRNEILREAGLSLERLGARA